MKDEESNPVNNAAAELLLPALRQYKHNDGEGFVPGYEYAATQAVVGELMAGYRTDAACAAIDYVLSNECDGDELDFLRCWNEGSFDTLRQEWQNVPAAVFIGADTQFADVSHKATVDDVLTSLYVAAVPLDDETIEDKVKSWPESLQQEVFDYCIAVHFLSSDNKVTVPSRPSILDDLKA